MLLPFFLELRAAKIPVTLREFLTLIEAMGAHLVDDDVDGFYVLSRAALIKDERHIDRFDQVFAHVFKGLAAVSGAPEGPEPTELPAEWLARLADRVLSAEDKAEIAALGGFEALMETLRQRLAEQTGRHQGGSKWIGTGGTSPFGAGGYNPEGVRIGQDSGRNRKAAKVWDQRAFRDLDDSVEIGTRNIKVALKRLRQWVREGADDELDLPETIRSTAEHGYIDVRTRPERKNAIRLLMFFDIGGSMDEHVRIAEALFSAARSEFRQMKHYYFHNCLYEEVWTNNLRRRSSAIPTEDILRTYGADHRVILVGDAAMSPYEITMAGGSVEHWNKEAGAVWLNRLTTHFRKVAWLNPVKEEHWGWSQSTGIIRGLIDDRMYPLTLGGLKAATRALSR